MGWDGIWIMYDVDASDLTSMFNKVFKEPWATELTDKSKYRYLCIIFYNGSTAQYNQDDFLLLKFIFLIYSKTVF